MLIRQIHAYIGALIAPSVLFFALTGALQLFSLHEAHDGYQPPQIIERLGHLHKDQVITLGDHHGPPPPADAAAPAADHAPADHAPADHAAADHAAADHADHDHADHAGPAAKGGDSDEPALKTILLKWVFLLVALGLVSTTLVGVWIGLTRRRGRVVSIVLLAVGAALPVLLLII